MSLLAKFRLDGRAALVTGSDLPQGIGRAIALGLAESGARVAIHEVEPSAALDETLAAVRALSPGSVAVTGNLRRPEQATRIVSEAAAGLGGLDIVVANAGRHILRRWTDITQDEAEEQMQVNFHSLLRLIQAAAPAMRANKWGRIVAIGSVQQFHPHPDMAVYAASKSAIDNLVRNLAAQLGPDGITVNTLSPGLVLTKSTRPFADDAAAKRVLALIPVGFFGLAEDIAGCALLLCSEAGRYINGANFRVDGGRSTSLPPSSLPLGS